MGTPTISVKSKLAKVVAQTLQSTPGKLDKADGEKNGQIWIRGLQTPNVIQVDQFTNCWTTILIDNGDGKVGKGDLFLQGYPPLRRKGNHEFRYAKLFEPRKVQPKGKNDETDPKLTFKSNKLLKVVESHKGQPYGKNLLKALKKTCGK